MTFPTKMKFLGINKDCVLWFIRKCRYSFETSKSRWMWGVGLRPLSFHSVEIFSYSHCIVDDLTRRPSLEKPDKDKITSCLGIKHWPSSPVLWHHTNWEGLIFIKCVKHGIYFMAVIPRGSITIFSVLPKACVCVLLMVLPLNSDYCPKQHYPAGLCSQHALCYLCDRDSIFYIILSISSFKVLWRLL
jgi:hypothetical protein